MFSDRTLQFGEALTTALLGLDQLYAAEQAKSGTTSAADIERLVVLNLSSTHLPDRFTTYDDAITRFTELRVAASTLPEVDRRRYYEQTCASAIAFATWRSRGMPFEQQIARFLHLPAIAAGDVELAALRHDMHVLLNELGFTGAIEQQLQAWESRHRVPADEVAETLVELLSEAWDRTSQIMSIPADKSDGMRVETVRDAPYNAMCDFSTRTIRLNIDPVLTRPSLKHLAVHEGYPGHYVQFKRRQHAYLTGNAPADGLLSVVNTASSAPFEGIADAGLDLIGWQDDPDGRLAALLARYRSGLGTRAAWRMHAQRWPDEQTRDELARDALIGGAGWVDNRIRFIARDDRAALIWSYWHGEPPVAAVWNQIRHDRTRWPAYFTYIYDRMHSIETIGMFH